MSLNCRSSLLPLKPSRVDPKGGGHVFLVHGQACAKSLTRPQCGFAGGGTPPSKMFVIDVKDLMGSEWRVRPAALVLRLALVSALFLPCSYLYRVPAPCSPASQARSTTPLLFNR